MGEAVEKIEEAEEVKREELLKKTAASWNRLVKNLQGVAKNWETYTSLILENGIGIEEFPLEAQKILYLANPRGDFSFILEDIITHPRFERYLEELFIKLD